MTRELWTLMPIVALAFTVEASLGFGATIVAVSLGALVMPIDRLLPAFVPLNLVLSIWLAVQGRKHVDVSLLARRVVPFMAIGLPVGMWAFRALPSPALAVGFGVFTIGLATLELARGSNDDGRALSGPVGAGLLMLGGAVHGAFGTGGPMAVYVIGRKLADKDRFRATLAVLWLVLNAVLVGGYAWDGRTTTATLQTSALLGGALVVGLGLGEALHRKVPASAFRVLVYTMLWIAGAALVARNL